MRKATIEKMEIRTFTTPWNPGIFRKKYKNEFEDSSNTSNNRDGKNVTHVL